MALVRVYRLVWNGADLVRGVCLVDVAKATIDFHGHPGGWGMQWLRLDGRDLWVAVLSERAARSLLWTVAFLRVGSVFSRLSHLGTVLERCSHQFAHLLVGGARTEQHDDNAPEHSLVTSPHDGEPSQDCGDWRLVRQRCRHRDDGGLIDPSRNSVVVLVFCDRAGGKRNVLLLSLLFSRGRLLAHARPVADGVDHVRYVRSGVLRCARAHQALVSLCAHHTAWLGLWCRGGHVRGRDGNDAWRAVGCGRSGRSAAFCSRAAHLWPQHHGAQT